MVARTNGSGGDCAPTPVPTEIYEPGIMCRTLLPKTFLTPIKQPGCVGVGGALALGNPPSTGPFILHTVSHQQTVHGSHVLYLLTDGTNHFWESPANVRRIDPPAPSGFVAVPPETPPDNAAGAKAPYGHDIGITDRTAEGLQDQKAVLLMAYRAQCIGSPLVLECDATEEFGRDRLLLTVEKLLLQRMLYPVGETDDSPAGWCLTTEGDVFVRSMYKADIQERRQQAAPPESGDMTADHEAKPSAAQRPTGIDWRAWGRAGQESTDGRFRIELKGNYYTPTDAWTDETGGEHALLTSAQSWCSKREVVEPLTWARTGSVSAERAKLCECARFEVVPRPIGKFMGIDCRLSPSTVLRCSAHFDTRELAQRWCEVRACCDVLPDGGLRYRSPIPF